MTVHVRRSCNNIFKIIIKKVFVKDLKNIIKPCITGIDQIYDILDKHYCHVIIILNIVTTIVYEHTVHTYIVDLPGDRSCAQIL